MLIDHHTHFNLVRVMVVARLPAYGAGVHGEAPLQGVLSVCGFELGDLEGRVYRGWRRRGL